MSHNEHNRRGAVPIGPVPPTPANPCTVLRARSSVAGAKAHLKCAKHAARADWDRFLKMKGQYTAKSVNAAFKAVKGFKTDILCKPWYYGSAPLRIPVTLRSPVPHARPRIHNTCCRRSSSASRSTTRTRSARRWQHHRADDHDR